MNTQSTDPIPQEIRDQIDTHISWATDEKQAKESSEFGYSLAAERILALEGVIRDKDERIKELEAEVKRLAYLADYWQEKKK